METPSPTNPLGVKGIGELPTVATPVAAPAVASATPAPDPAPPAEPVAPPARGDAAAAGTRERRANEPSTPQVA